MERRSLSCGIRCFYIEGLVDGVGCTIRRLVGFCRYSRLFVSVLRILCIWLILAVEVTSQISNLQYMFVPP